MTDRGKTARTEQAQAAPAQASAGATAAEAKSQATVKTQPQQYEHPKPEVPTGHGNNCLRMLAEIRAKDNARSAEEAHQRLKQMHRDGIQQVIYSIKSMYERRAYAAWSCLACKECRGFRPPTPVPEPEPVVVEKRDAGIVVPRKAKTTAVTVELFRQKVATKKVQRAWRLYARQKRESQPETFRKLEQHGFWPTTASPEKSSPTKAFAAKMSEDSRKQITALVRSGAFGAPEVW